MKTYYYNVDDREFTLSSGDRLRVVPELFYQEHAVWRLCLRDRKDLPIDISAVTAWQAAVDNNYCSGSAPMARVLADGIIADAESGAVVISLDATAAEFLAAVNGATVKPAYFELVGFNAQGERSLYVSFEIAARMTLDPDPTASGEIPETLATRTQVSAMVAGALDPVSSSLDSRITNVSSGLQSRPTSGGASQIASNVIASGGFMKLPAEVVSGGSVGYIPVLSGGMCYRFTDPLVALSVGSITSSLDETDILFTAGAVVSPPVSVTVSYQTGNDWGWDEDEDTDTSTPTYTNFVLVSSGNGYAPCAIDLRAWYDFTDEGDDHDGQGCNTYYSELSNGSFTCTSAGGKWVVSAVGISQYISNTIWEWDGEANDGDGDYIENVNERTEVIAGWVASSTDLTSWTVNRALTINVGWMDDYLAGAENCDETAIITASATVTPCDVVLPSGALLVNSSAVTVKSGHRYEMNLKHGAIVTGEVMEASNE